MNKKKKCAKRCIIKQQILNIGWNLRGNSTQDSSLRQANDQNARKKTGNPRPGLAHFLFFTITCMRQIFDLNPTPL